VEARKPRTSQIGKFLSFFGVMLLVVGLMGGDAGAAGQGKGKDDAPGQVKKQEQNAALAAESANNLDCGAYCSTSDGSPSLNGNGNGDAGGKPCAGCVGNADNKNPPGQFKDGDDPNNGYECDGNNGIAKGNPAHSACKPTTTTVPQQTTTTVAQQTTTTVAQQETTTTVAGDTTTTVAVEGSTVTTEPEVLGVQFSRGSGDPLAATGAGFMRPFTLAGALLLLLGMALMIIRVRPVRV
jgi:hypothetical protein